MASTSSQIESVEDSIVDGVTEVPILPTASHPVSSEQEPLLPEARPGSKKPWYRPRPLMYVSKHSLLPHLNLGAQASSIRHHFSFMRMFWRVWSLYVAKSVSQRGMTLAPRVQVFTQLACDLILPAQNVSNTSIPHQMSPPSSYLSDDGSASNQNASVVVWFSRTPYERCLEDPVVSAKASRLQTGASPHVMVEYLLTRFASFIDHHGYTVGNLNWLVG